jgi:hypothetical protein
VIRIAAIRTLPSAAIDNVDNAAFSTGWRGNRSMRLSLSAVDSPQRAVLAHGPHVAVRREDSTYAGTLLSSKTTAAA